MKNLDKEELKKLYREYLPKVEAMVHNNGKGTKDQAFDIFQEGLIILLQKIAQPEFKLTSSFSTLLYGICFNLWRNERKKMYGKEVTLGETKTFSDEGQLAEMLREEAEMELFLEKLKELREKCRKLLELFFSGEKYESIKEQLGYATAASARRQKHKCQQQLISKIKADKRFKDLSNGE